VAFDDRLDLGKVDLVIFPDHRARLIFSKRQAAMATVGRAVIFHHVRRFRQTASMALMAGLGPAGARTLALRFPVRRWRLRGCPRGLVRPLQTQQQIDQFPLRKPLKILAIHRQDESQTATLGKGVGNYLRSIPVTPLIFPCYAIRNSLFRQQGILMKKHVILGA
jgi:hypothetical protein